jgi:hypothetical protein
MIIVALTDDPDAAEEDSIKATVQHGYGSPDDVSSSGRGR